MVTALSLGVRPVSWNVPNRARPIVMDSSRGAVLGVTAGDGETAVPLDAELGLIVNHVARFLWSTSHAILFSPAPAVVGGSSREELWERSAIQG